MPDWTAAVDAVLCERMTTCTGCGNPAGDNVRLSVWQTPAVAVANILCRRCRAIDPEGTALDALMRQRYGAAGKEES
jgi:hypothetical protein